MCRFDNTRRDYCCRFDKETEDRLLRVSDAGCWFSLVAGNDYRGLVRLMYARSNFSRAPTYANDRLNTLEVINLRDKLGGRAHDTGRDY